MMHLSVLEIQSYDNQVVAMVTRLETRTWPLVLILGTKNQLGYFGPAILSQPYKKGMVNHFLKIFPEEIWGIS